MQKVEGEWENPDYTARRRGGKRLNNEEEYMIREVEICRGLQRRRYGNIDLLHFLVLSSGTFWEEVIAYFHLTRHGLYRNFFVNPLLFASCTNTFSKWCKVTRGMKRSAQ
jgi:hypothetical protein